MGIEASAPISGGDGLVTAGALTLLGELHGTCEAPQAIFDLAQPPARRGAVRIGLELPVSEQARVDQFLVDGDRAALLAGPFWTRRLQDGRSSAAMLGLIDNVRQLRRRGGKVDLFLFDIDRPEERSRDEAMADHIARELRAAPRASFLILVGNVHARTVRGGVSWDPTYLPLGAILAIRYPLTSINLAYRGGTAWVCGQDDPKGQIHSVRGRDLGDERRVTRYPHVDDAGYHGELYVGDLNASPPAVSDRSATDDE